MIEKLLYNFVELSKNTMYRRDRQIRCRHKAVAKYADKNVLEIGGSELPNIYLPKETIMLDVVEPSLKLPTNYSQFVFGSAIELSKYFSENSFNTIIASEVIEHIPNHCDFFIETYKCLKPSGRLVLTSPNPLHVYTIVGNLFFPKGFSKTCDWKGKDSIRGPYYGHIHLHIPRILNVIAKLAGYEIEDIQYLLGFGRLFSATVLYVYKKSLK